MTYIYSVGYDVLMYGFIVNLLNQASNTAITSHDYFL